MAFVNAYVTVRYQVNPPPSLGMFSLFVSIFDDEQGYLTHCQVADFGVVIRGVVSVSSELLEFTTNSFKKRFVITFEDLGGNVRSINAFISVPDFNMQRDTDWTLAHTQFHQIAPQPPPPVQPPPAQPPPVVIPPPTESPVEIVLQPPDQPPRPIDLPPEGPPPEHPPRRPPRELQPPISPRETDAETFRRFLERWGHQLDWVSVNVPLDGGEWVEDLEEPYRSLWAKLTQHKADVVFRRKGVIYVAEVKPRLSRGAIGEAFVAHMMYRKLYKPAEETRAAVICMTASPLLLQYAGMAGLLVFVTDAIDGTGWFGEVRIRHRMR